MMCGNLTPETHDGGVSLAEAVSVAKCITLCLYHGMEDTFLSVLY